MSETTAKSEATAEVKAAVQEEKRTKAEEEPVKLLEIRKNEPLYVFVHEGIRGQDPSCERYLYADGFDELADTIYKELLGEMRAFKCSGCTKCQDPRRTWIHMQGNPDYEVPENKHCGHEFKDESELPEFLALCRTMGFGNGSMTNVGLWRVTYGLQPVNEKLNRDEWSLPVAGHLMVATWERMWSFDGSEDRNLDFIETKKIKLLDKPDMVEQYER